MINLRNNDEIAAVTKVSADIIETEDEMLEETEMTDNEQVVEGSVEGVETQEIDETVATEETTDSEE